MALPKRKISKTRGRKRRTHWVAKAPQLGTCTQCNTPILSYRACPECGTYNGRTIIPRKNT